MVDSLRVRRVCNFVQTTMHSAKFSGVSPEVILALKSEMKALHTALPEIESGSIYRISAEMVSLFCQQDLDPRAQEVVFFYFLEMVDAKSPQMSFPEGLDLGTEVEFAEWFLQMLLREWIGNRNDAVETSIFSVFHYFNRSRRPLLDAFIGSWRMVAIPEEAVVIYEAYFACKKRHKDDSEYIEYYAQILRDESLKSRDSRLYVFMNNLGANAAKYYDEFVPLIRDSICQLIIIVCRYGKEKHRLHLFRVFMDLLSSGNEEFDILVLGHFSNSSADLRGRVEEVLEAHLGDPGSFSSFRMNNIETELHEYMYGFKCLSEDLVQKLVDILDWKYSTRNYSTDELDRLQFRALITLIQSLCGQTKHLPHAKLFRKKLLAKVLTRLQEETAGDCAAGGFYWQSMLLAEDVLMLGVILGEDPEMMKGILSNSLMQRLEEFAFEGMRLTSARLDQAELEKISMYEDDMSCSYSEEDDTAQIASICAFNILMVVDRNRWNAFFSKKSPTADIGHIRDRLVDCMFDSGISSSFVSLLKFALEAVDPEVQIDPSWKISGDQQHALINAPIIDLCLRVWANSSRAELLPVKLHMVGVLVGQGCPLGELETQVFLELAEFKTCLGRSPALRE